MRQIIIFSIFILHASINAQTFTAKYTSYKDQKAIKDSLSKNEDMAKFLGEEMINDLISQMSEPQDYTLVYSNGKSVYKADVKEIEEDNDELSVGSTGISFKISKSENSPILYKDFESNSFTKQETFFNKKFLINGELSSLDWEVTDETKKFGDFTCTVAIATNKKGQKVSACYSEDIPINEGPDDYYGLPGLVLEVVKGPLHINMTEIKITENTTPINAPDEGKKVTKKEYDKIVKKKMEQLKTEGGMSVFH